MLISFIFKSLFLSFALLHLLPLLFQPVRAHQTSIHKTTKLWDLVVQYFWFRQTWVCWSVSLRTLCYFCVRRWAFLRRRPGSQQRRHLVLFQGQRDLPLGMESIEACQVQLDTYVASQEVVEVSRLELGLLTLRRATSRVNFGHSCLRILHQPSRICAG